MQTAEAQKLLGLAPQANARDIRDAHARRASQLSRERELAITRSLRERIELELEKIKAARDCLLAQASSPRATELPGELPLTSPPERDAPVRSAMPFSTTGNARVLDRYDLGEKLGSGGMGEVFAAFDRLTSQPVAIKFISERISSRSDSLQRFLSEARLSCRLSHPNIVRTFDVHEAAGRYFITMELLEGQTLRQYIGARCAAGAQFERIEISRILHQICVALAYAHKDLVHRDIKPENVWRCADGSIKIMDFGVALEINSADLAEASAALGTEGYRAPEQTTGADPVDQRADQFAVACIAIEMLCAPDPCRPAQLRTDRLARRDPVRSVLERALAGRASDRYDTILAFEGALRAALLHARWRGLLNWALPLALLAALALGAYRLAFFKPPPVPVLAEDTRALSTDPEIAAQARISEARALLAAVDTLVEQSGEHLQALQAELVRLEQGRGNQANPAQQIAKLQQDVADANLLLARGHGWALLGNERIAVEKHLGAAAAASKSEKWPDAERQAQAAVEQLSASRAQLIAVDEELQALRRVDAGIDDLRAGFGGAAEAPEFAAQIAQLRLEMRALRDSLPTASLAAVREARVALELRLQRATASAGEALRAHWQERAARALRQRKYAELRSALKALQDLGVPASQLVIYRRALDSAASAARSAEDLRRQQQQDELELQNEQARYRPQRGPG